MDINWRRTILEVKLLLKIVKVVFKTIYCRIQQQLGSLWNRAIKQFGGLVRLGLGFNFFNRFKVGLLWLDYKDWSGLVWKFPNRLRLNWFGLDKAKLVKPKLNHCWFLINDIEGHLFGIVIQCVQNSNNFIEIIIN